MLNLKLLIPRWSVFLFFTLVGSAAMAAAPAGPAADDLPAVHALRQWLAQPREGRPELARQPFAASALTKAQADQATQLLWDDHADDVRASRVKEWNDKAIVAGGQTLKFLERQFGNKPKSGWSLYISLHGGGNAPRQVNDQQWNNQIKLYQPKDCLYIAPRAPTDNWDLWHEANVDALLGRLLEDAFVLADVNPNRVYIMGYSAGGDGVYQLAPRMADRWAAAAMMAGHPNDASPLGLRNIGFTIHVGALDDAYNRNKVAAEWGKKLDDLRAADPRGYEHVVKLHAGRAHWMNLEDKVAVKWMAGFTRNPLPLKVVWMQSNVTHDRFYWLAVPPGKAKGGALAIVSRQGQNIEVEKAEGLTQLTILLNDAMLDLDQPIVVTMKGRELFKGKAPRTIGNLYRTLARRGDRDLMFDAAVPVSGLQK